MFNHLGWGEIVVLIIVGLIIFGPDRLPKAAADAARILRQLRAMAHNATADLRAELGPEMADLDLASLHPRRIMQSALFDEPEAPAPTPVGGHPTLPLTPGEPPPFDVDAT